MAPVAPARSDWEAALSTATPDSLLRVFAALTHRMHAEPADSTIRSQRDKVQTEILRRMT